MKAALVTGLNGRLAPLLKAAFEKQSIAVVTLDRQLVDSHNRSLQLAFLRNHGIDAIFQKPCNNCSK